MSTLKEKEAPVDRFGFTYISRDIREGLGTVGGWLARALTFDTPRGDSERYRATVNSLRICGSLDLFRVYQSEFAPMSGWVPVLQFVAAFLGVFPKFDRIATVVFAVGYWNALFNSFPFTWNHTWLGVYMFTWLALVPAKDVNGRKLSIAGVRMVTLYSLIGAGVQKLIHGTYFRGEFMASRGWQFSQGAMGKFLFTENDTAQFGDMLSVFDGRRIVPESIPLKIASNIVWAGETIAGVVLLIPRWSLWGLLLIVALMIPIQLGTLEFGFLGLLLAALVSYVPDRMLRYCPWFATVYVGVVLFLWHFTYVDTDTLGGASPDSFFKPFLQPK